MDWCDQPDADAEPIAAHLDLTDDEFAGYRLVRWVVESWSHEWRANWKVAAENGHENYHARPARQTLEPFVFGGGDLDVRHSRWASGSLHRSSRSRAVTNEVQKAPGQSCDVSEQRAGHSGRAGGVFGFVLPGDDRVQVPAACSPPFELRRAAATAQTSAVDSDDQ
ncbi:SRPBCC family protein [Mycobacterium tuberculosis]